jgi:flagellin-like protein
MSKKRANKKALSPVIATALLIMLVLVLAVTIFFWLRGLISEQVEKKGADIKFSCDNVNVEVKKTTLNKLVITNRGNVPVEYFEIRQTTAGTSVTRNSNEAGDSSVIAGDSISISIPTSNPNAINPSAEFVLFPVLVGNVKGDTTNRKYYTCETGIKVPA